MPRPEGGAGITFVDSTSLALCHPRRISRHKVFAGYAIRGKSSMGWFFGCKLHRMINNYISKALHDTLLATGLKLITFIRRTMKPRLMRLWERLMLMCRLSLGVGRQRIRGSKPLLSARYQSLKSVN